MDVVCVAISVMMAAAPQNLAADLRAGMTLQYTSDGRDQPPWSIESVETAVPLNSSADCARVGIRRQPDGAVDESRLCVEGGMVVAWDDKQRAFVPQRPAGPGLQLTQRRANGDTVTYATGATHEEIVSGVRLQVIETTVTTANASGQNIRRLRERYAITLTTATGGVFEVPDPAAASGWRAQQVFELRDIRQP